MTARVVVDPANTTAELGADFDFPTFADVTWGSGDDAAKAVAIPLRNDASFETPDERIGNP